ncbi:von Willebrand factor A domain-containing protein 5A [Colletotrichum sidae]|uniref:von Willebrand factor A domain-containing protein 5A n=1 Tax=Colletotrichum sidae TaxID=1347389 RepID=A0A4V3I3W5_9PEZI|nr:von Willebrand factor A domain-containing protein 5A [Colletotrichum sidae]
MDEHICGLYYLGEQSHHYYDPQRNYLPTVSQSLHARIVASTSRTTLTQTFVNPPDHDAIPEVRYTFPLYDGVSVVAFTCTINNDRVIRGVVQEKNQARKTFDDAVARGETAGLLEQLPDASDVFTTTIGNVPTGAEIKIEIVYLGELKHDAEVDGIRFTIPTSVAPRYGSYPGTLIQKPANVSTKGIEIIVDAEMPDGSTIKSIRSPSHPIAVSVGSTSTMAANATPSLRLASATLSLGTAELQDDFIVQVIATNTSNPVAVLETHPAIPHQQAIMATLVPKFKLSATKPEVVFICDRSGSMDNKIGDLKSALHVFLKSLPVGCMFNICSFGSDHSFLFPKSKMYDQDTLRTAAAHIDKFEADMGGTEIHRPLEDTFERRHKDMDLEAFVLTDGEVWDQEELFDLVNDKVDESKGAIRLFTLGVGRDVSHSLIEGLARAGRGFSQAVSAQEQMSGKVVRMLRGALTPHVNDYSLEVKYADAESETEAEDDFEIIEAESASNKDASTEEILPQEQKKPISLFDTANDDDVEMKDTDADDQTGADRFSHVPTVKPPKVLQSPFQIPPLYPYNRTSVYLLLSPERALRDKTPQSVILRGTSVQGPLELEIPITVLSKPDETVHQLAAKQAMKELEEGRGWIFGAKSRDGETLQKKHTGRFPAMVEREAVRLGIRFQVAGGWCSFVAVEGDDKASSAGAAQIQAVTAHESVERGSSQASRPRVGMKAFRQAAPQSPRYNMADAFAQRSVFPAAPAPGRGGGLFGTAAHSFGRARPGGQLFGGRPSNGTSFFGQPSSRTGYRGGGNAVLPPPPPPFISLASKAPSRLVKKKTTGADKSCAVDFESMGYSGGIDTSLDDFDFDSFLPDGVSPGAALSANAPILLQNASLSLEAGASSTAPFHALVSLQDFSGFWAWCDELLRVVGLTEKPINEALPGASRDALSTAVVVAFLRKRLSDVADSWEMMEEKAVAWLKQEVGEDVTGELLLAAEGLF